MNRLDILDKAVILECEVHDCVAELYLNGVPVGLCGLGASRKAAIPVQEFLIDGVNEIAVLINPGDAPATSLEASAQESAAWGARPPMDPATAEFADVQDEPKPDPDAEEFPDPDLDDVSGAKRWTERHINFDVEGLPAKPTTTVSARLVQYAIGSIPGQDEGEALISIGWDAHPQFENVRREPRPYPRWVRGDQNLGKAYGPLHWQTSDKLKLDADTLAGAKGFVAEVITHLEGGNVDPILALSKERFREVCRAYGLDRAKRVAALKHLVAEGKHKRNWLFETPADDEWSFRLCADDRLIECVGPDWKPVVREVPQGEEGRFLYPMMLGKVGGAWRIMR